ncbi:phosphatidylglycerophosphatase B [Erwinia psidii]|uniref:undecaprenyl-diphosphate phosphatase n=1 Tax=Erwinia psidii TaxID=69224 RepID=A0A3N6RZM3_9GAMM|nr:phosphatidylglycerophosphatase B [Erwinia psidii]MCX8955952.1 phosphatidylglycerophosphatase B [Erwinia psidii]MCX8961324.1 phosphatidylglycerophosphatase B [Erwinia psidii]MCX8963829.1 phosphatidylglycerophosphatase B [Erwinia psidii]RQM38664.1 phosphatidylglycerophosphatase B [Erwinia psidii]
MFDIVRRTMLGAVLLLIMPVMVWISDWQWRPGENGLWQRMLFWMTETVTSPWGAVTSVVLCVWFTWCLRYRLKPTLMLLAIMLLAILAGQCLKTLIKEQVQEPRPYVLWLEKSHALDEKTFYQQPRQQRSELVVKAVASNNCLPVWLKSHWAFETGYAFPSGHTMFAASWALLAIGLLWPRRRFVTLTVLFIWATGVMGSRLVLGMHWPRDLVISTLISWLLVTCATWLVQRYCGPLSVQPEEQREINERERR